METGSRRRESKSRRAGWPVIMKLLQDAFRRSLSLVDGERRNEVGQAKRTDRFPNGAIQHITLGPSALVPTRSSGSERGAGRGLGALIGIRYAIPGGAQGRWAPAGFSLARRCGSR
jgi:hypothetical protein